MTPDQIKAFRESLGLGTPLFARAIGVSDGSTVRAWERGHSTPEGATITLLTMAQEVPGCREWLVKRARRRA